MLQRYNDKITQQKRAQTTNRLTCTNDPLLTCTDEPLNPLVITLVISAMIIQDIFPYVHIFPFKKNSFDCEGVENGGMMF